MKLGGRLEAHSARPWPAHRRLPGVMRARSTAVAPENGHGNMTATGAKIRLAVAVYDEPEKVWLTVERLQGRGMGVSQVGFILRASTLGRLVTDLAGRCAENKSLRSWLAACAGLEDASGTRETVVVSPVLLSLWKTGYRIPALWAPRLADELAPRLAEDLQRWIEKGSTVLTVEPSTRQELWDATRVLLKMSTCPVMTLEYSTPDP